MLLKNLKNATAEQVAMKIRKSVVQAVLFHFIFRAGARMVFMGFFGTALVTKGS